MRPVSAREHGELAYPQYRLPDHSAPRLLDVVRVGLSEARALPYQPENWGIDGTPWVLIERPAAAERARVAAAAVSQGPLLLGSPGRSVPVTQFRNHAAPESLAIVKPANLQWRTTFNNYLLRNVPRVIFDLEDVSYNLPLTDPAQAGPLAAARGRRLYFGRSGHPRRSPGFTDDQLGRTVRRNLLQTGRGRGRSSSGMGRVAHRYQIREKQALLTDYGYNMGGSTDMLLPIFVLLFPGLNTWAAPSSADVCGRCHRDIYASWKKSAHANAMQDDLFQKSLALTESDFSAEARKSCLECHAPIDSTAQEGVTCDYCHSVHRVTFGGPNPKAHLTFSQVKAGPISHAVPVEHKAVFTSVHASAEICAPCHEHRNGLGFPVLTTYSEWKESRYAKENHPCQSCHMGPASGEVVDEHVRNISTGHINSHEMPGSHSAERLAKAIGTDISTAREGPNVKVMVELENQAAGHDLPTGSPLRQLVLEIQADSAGGQHFRERRVFARQVADQHGTVLMREHFTFVNASKLVSDTRLRPGEKRAETFLIPLPEGDRAHLEATLWFYYSPLAEKESETRVRIETIQREVQ